MRLLPVLFLTLPLVLSSLSPSPQGSAVSAKLIERQSHPASVNTSQLRRRAVQEEDSEGTDDDGSEGGSGSDEGDSGSEDGSEGENEEDQEVNAASASKGSGYPSIPSVQEVEDNELKEFHFHLYFNHHNREESLFASRLRERIIELKDEEYFHAHPAPLHMKPVGPHPTGNLEVWTPKEEYSRVYDFVTSNRGNLSVLIHPISSQQRRDHSDRAVWLGRPLNLNFAYIRTDLGRIPLEHSDLGLGYSAKDDE
ncbi:MAG: DOPA-like domain-containing protein [Piptocephalis tieghemiana]|nr:MAG: DOPA-like domain-containing protein [Piptocephalis tieghemiana]